MKRFVATTLAVIIAIGILPGSQGSNRFPRRAGDQAKNGACVTFQWGGISGASGYYVHHYTCCNNCNSTDESCDSTTYHAASGGTYCDSCGTDNSKGNARTKGSDYTCGGCPGQKQSQTVCQNRMGITYRIPGFCWVFTWCFRYYCENPVETRTRRSDDSCFDLVCNNGETTGSCPSDCCGTVNEKCDWRKNNGTNNCVPDCCGESTCCNVNAGLTAESSPWLLTLTLLAYVGHLLFWHV